MKLRKKSRIASLGLCTDGMMHGSVFEGRIRDVTLVEERFHLADAADIYILENRKRVPKPVQGT